MAPPGVDPAPLAEGTETGDRLLCVAAVTPRKAQDVLVAALGSLGGLNWECVIAGALDRSPTFAAGVRAIADRRIRFAGTRTGAALDVS